MAVSHVYSNAQADATGTITVWNGATTATVAATNVVRPSDWNSAHNQYYTLSGNTTNASTASGTNVVLQGAGGVPLGTACVDGDPIVGSNYFEVPLDAVILTKSPRSAIVVARCS